MKFCPKCGAKCDDSDQFCTTCGAKFKSKETDYNQEFIRKTTAQSQPTRIRYTEGPLGYIRPEVFWPIAGIIYFFLCLYNRGGIIWGVLIGILRPVRGATEWKYFIATIVIVLVLINI